MQSRLESTYSGIPVVKNLMKVLWHRGVIQLTCGVRSSVSRGFEPSHGSVTARVEISISCQPTSEILAIGAKAPLRLYLQLHLSLVFAVDKRFSVIVILKSLSGAKPSEKEPALILWADVGNRKSQLLYHQ